MRVSENVLRGVMCGALLGACTESDDVVVQNSDPAADFASYKTFAFAQPPATGAQSIPSSDSDNLSLINDEAKSQLEKLGLSEVDASSNPDVVVFSLISTKTKTNLSWNCLPAYWYGNWEWSFDPCSILSNGYDEFAGGTFAVGLVDPVLGATVFGGIAENALVGSENDMQRLIDGAVDTIFKSYPKDQTGK